MTSSEPAPLRATLSLWLVLFVIWTAANGTLEPSVAVLGLVVTLGIAALYTRASHLWNDMRFSPARGFAFLQYSLVFLWEMVKSNIIVLGYVFSPRIRISPGIVQTQTRMKTPIGRLVLTNSVALTPGTLVLDVDGRDVFVHALDVTSTDMDVNSRAVLGPFEPTLSRAFG